MQYEASSAMAYDGYGLPERRTQSVNAFENKKFYQLIQ